MKIIDTRLRELIISTRAEFEGLSVLHGLDKDPTRLTAFLGIQPLDVTQFMIRDGLILCKQDIREMITEDRPLRLLLRSEEEQPAVVQLDS